MDSMKSFEAPLETRTDKLPKDQTLKEYERQWEKAGLEDNFVFFKVMQDKSLCLELLQRIFPGLDIVKIAAPEQEKVTAFANDTKSIRMDLLVREVDNKNDQVIRIFNLEMQVVSNRVLPKRSRYYQSMLDVDILEKGGNYEELMPSYVVFICLKDMFYDNRVKYTFKNICKENYEELGDDREIIFLNASGEFGEVSEELQNFLDFLRNKTTKDEFTRRLGESVKRVKESSTMRGEYIKMITERSFWVEEGREQGREEGREQGRAEILKKNIRLFKDELHKTDEEIIVYLEQVFGVSEEHAKSLLTESLLTL